MTVRITFAPLEGITGYIYRNAHHACFPSMDRYYTPFITPKKGKSFTTREWNDIAAEHNQNIAVVPQILTNQAEGFCKVAGMIDIAAAQLCRAQRDKLYGCYRRNAGELRR